MVLADVTGVNANIRIFRTNVRTFCVKINLFQHFDILFVRSSVIFTALPKCIEFSRKNMAIFVYTKDNVKI